MPLYRQRVGAGWRPSGFQTQYPGTGPGLPSFSANLGVRKTDLYWTDSAPILTVMFERQQGARPRSSRIVTANRAIQSGTVNPYARCSGRRLRAAAEGVIVGQTDGTK